MDKRLQMWSLVLVLLFLVERAWAQQCSQISGPSGNTACLKIPNYNNQYQWAVCVTNSFMKQRSGQFIHNCVNPNAAYCWYQCMLEVYSREFGPVSNLCSCVPGQTSTSTLPLECKFPSGNSCDWYRNCLERKYHCEDTSNAYAIRYAEKFCLLNERRALFSPEGQKWVDAARRCLQLHLVPLLRPWVAATCNQMRQGVFTTHNPCYLRPEQNVSSICDLNCTDYFRIFWAIRGSFPKLDTAWESLKGLWNIETICSVSSQVRQCFQGKADEIMNFIKVRVQTFEQNSERSAVSLPVADAGSRFADGVGSSIARILKWNTFVMEWVAYISGSFSSSDDVDIIIVLGDSKALGIVTTSSPSINFNHTIHEFAAATEEGKFPLQVDGYNVWVKSLALCSDKSCARTQTLAISDKPPDWPIINGGSRVSCGIVGLFGIIAVLFIYQLFF